MRWVRRLLWIGVLAATLVAGWLFAASNDVPVRVHYLVGETLDLALWKALVGAFAAGALVVGVFALLSALRHGLMQHRYRKLISGLESEVHQLRNLPLAPEPEGTGPRATDVALVSGAGRDA
jgi:uncharacterized integral membrane protein